VAASLAFWGLRWVARPVAVPNNTSSVTLDGVSQGDIRRLLAGPEPSVAGAPVVDASAASALSARLKLLGVVAPRTGTDQGVALLSIDGKPPRAIRVGGMVDGDLVVLAIGQRGAQIGPQQGPALLSLDLPPLPAASTGALPEATGVSIGRSPSMSGMSGMPGTPGMSVAGAGDAMGVPTGGQLKRAPPQAMQASGAAGGMLPQDGT
jgi:general secretion pathway protein C